MDEKNQKRENPQNSENTRGEEGKSNYSGIIIWTIIILIIVLGLAFWFVSSLFGISEPDVILDIPGV